MIQDFVARKTFECHNGIIVINLWIYTTRFAYSKFCYLCWFLYFILSLANHQSYISTLSIYRILIVIGCWVILKCKVEWLNSGFTHPPLKHFKQTSTPLSDFYTCYKRLQYWRVKATGAFIFVDEFALQIFG